MSWPGSPRSTEEPSCTHGARRPATPPRSPFVRRARTSGTGLGKGLSSGYLPLSAAIFKQEVAQHFEHQPFSHGMTYTGHPICCAPAGACIDVIREDGLVDNAARMGARMRRMVDELSRRHPCVGTAETLGLFSTIELVEDPNMRTAFGETDPLFPGDGGSPAQCRRRWRGRCGPKASSSGERPWR
jgi:hypothetical protein